MKQYTVTVHLRGCLDEGSVTSLVFSGYEAYQQWLLGRDLHGFVDNQGTPVEVIVPRHAISRIDLAVTESESTPVVDAFCGEAANDNPGIG